MIGRTNAQTSGGASAVPLQEIVIYIDNFEYFDGLYVDGTPYYINAPEQIIITGSIDTIAVSTYETWISAIHITTGNDPLDKQDFILTGASDVFMDYTLANGKTGAVFEHDEVLRFTSAVAELHFYMS